MTVQWTVFMPMRATGTASVGNSILTVLVILLRYYILFGTHAPGWSCPLGAGTSNRWSLFATPVKWNWNLELLFMRLNSYAPTSSLKIKSCPGQAPASGKVTAEPRRTWSCAWAACAGSFHGEVVEAGEVPGSERMTTLPCNLGSYDSWPSLNLIRQINLQK